MNTKVVVLAVLIAFLLAFIKVPAGAQFGSVHSAVIFTAS